MSVTEVDHRFPVGKFERPEKITEDDRLNAICIGVDGDHRRRELRLRSARCDECRRDDGAIVEMFEHFAVVQHIVRQHVAADATVVPKLEDVGAAELARKTYEVRGGVHEQADRNRVAVADDERTVVAAVEDFATECADRSAVVQE